MPTIAHALIGGGVAFLIYLIEYEKQINTNPKFTKAHVIIFTINSFVGPDIGKMGIIFGPISYLMNDIIHNFIGWICFAFPLAILYFFIFNKFKLPKKRKPSISFLHVYELIFAAGLIHFSLDVLDQSMPIFPNFDIFPEWRISLEGLKTGYSISGILSQFYPDFGFGELFIICMFFLVVIIWTFYKKTLKITIIVASVFIFTLICLFIFFGSALTHHENDIGFTLYGVIFWIAPIFICYLSFEKSSKKEIIEKTEK
ncbi:MAG: hypothetical protein ACTSRZ_03640 [Promethearchaeota archaeon]